MSYRQVVLAAGRRGRGGLSRWPAWGLALLLVAAVGVSAPVHAASAHALIATGLEREAPGDLASPEPGSGVFDEDTSRRVVGQADQSTDVYTNIDGSFTQVTHARPVNFVASDGSWQPIDTTLVKRADGRVHMAANSVQVSLSSGTATSRSAAASSGASGDELVQVTLPTGQVIAYNLQGAAIGTPVVRGSTATYRDVLPNTDLELKAFDSGEKETIILKSPGAANSWLFPLRLRGLTPRLEPDGAVAFLDSTGVAVAWLPRGFMEDSYVQLPAGERSASSDVTYELIDNDGQWALRVTAGQAWLRDPARVYPVRVDPSITTKTTTDAFVDNDVDTTPATQNGTSLAVGYDNDSPARSFIHFDDFNADGLAGKQITAATLRLWHTWSWDCTTHLPFYVYEVTQQWTATALGASTLPGPTTGATSIGSLTIADNYPACTNTGADRSKGAWRDVPLSVATLNNWAAGGNNYGLSLRASETDARSWKRFTSSDFSAGAFEPQLIVTYNAVPQVTARSTTPATSCVTGSARPALQTLTPTLSSTVSDGEGTAMSVTFEWWQVGASQALGSATKTSVASGSSTSHTFAAGALAEGGAYAWRVKASDGVSTSAWSSFCEFSVYVTVPPVAGCQSGVAGDFNGDGTRDVAIADPQATVNSIAEAGAINVVDGVSGVVSVVHQDLAEVVGAAEAGDQFGAAVSVYDANRDGCADLAVGTPREDNGTVVDAGEVQVLYGSPAGLGKSATAPALLYVQGSGGVPGTQAANDWFGFSLVGGQTSTGEPFLLVGAPGDDVNGYADAGTVHYFRGTLKLAWDQGSIGVGTVENDDQTGYAVAASPYHIVVSQPGEGKPAGTQFGGEVCVFSHTLTNNLPTLSGCVTQDSSGVSDVMEAGDLFGKSISMAPYWPVGDSILAVGVPGEDAVGGADVGLVHQLRVSGTMITQLAAIDQNTAFIADSNEPGDLFGEKVIVVNTNPSVAPTASTLLIAVGVPGEGTSGPWIDAGNVHVFAAGTATPSADTLVERATGKLPGTPIGRELLGFGLGSSPTELFVASPYGERAVWALPWSSLATGAVIPSRTWVPGVAGMPAGAVAFGTQVG